MPKLSISFGIKVGGPHSFTSAPNFSSKNIGQGNSGMHYISNNQYFLPSKFPILSSIEKASNKACVGCSCVPSPAFIMFALMCLAKKCGAPD